MKKLFLTVCLATLWAGSGLAEEPAGEHESKPPPKPSKDSPVTQVLNLSVVAEWKEWMSSRKNARVLVWGNSVLLADGKKCWEVEVGQVFSQVPHALRYFCVPEDGGEILVENLRASPDEDMVLTPYGKWVENCKPTASSVGNC